MTAHPHSHVAIVVPDLERAIAELSTMLGATFTEIGERPAGTWNLRIALTREGPPHLELIQGPVDSPWGCPDGPRIHHIGWWVNDRRAERERLTGEGLVPELAGDAVGLACDYYAGPDSGARIELTDASVREAFGARWGISV